MSGAGCDPASRSRGARGSFLVLVAWERGHPGRVAGFQPATPGDPPRPFGPPLPRGDCSVPSLEGKRKRVNIYLPVEGHVSSLCRATPALSPVEGAEWGSYARLPDPLFYLYPFFLFFPAHVGSDLCSASRLLLWSRSRGKEERMQVRTSRDVPKDSIAGAARHVCPGSLVIQETGQNATGTYPAASVRAE